MGYDRIWIESNEHPNGLLERTEAEEKNVSDGFEINFNRLYAQGHRVVLVAGKNHCFEELFLFENSSDAREFYEYGFQKWESFIGDDEEGCGFEQVALYRDGHLVATKSCEPSMRLEMRHQ